MKEATYPSAVRVLIPIVYLVAVVVSFVWLGTTYGVIALALGAVVAGTWWAALSRTPGGNPQLAQRRDASPPRV